MRVFWLVLFCVIPPGAAAAAEEKQPPIESLSAREAVRLGNQHLTSGDASAAMVAYSHARTLRPSAAEISFVEGLGSYALQEYTEARAAFQDASLSKNRKLADDALYSLGTTYHAEALASQEEPKQAIEKLEDAIIRYQGVLASQPDHESARDAIAKAASMRRRIMRMMEQQQKKDDGSPDSQQDPDDQDKQEEGGQDQQEQSDDENQEKSSEDQSSEDDQQQDQSSSQDEETEESSGEEADEASESEASRQQEETTSLEQAQRQLREMMQSLRERDKRRIETQPIMVQPLDKDW